MTTFFYRYNCFLCDYDICLSCKNIFEDQYDEGLTNVQNNNHNAGSAKPKNSDGSKVVCLKTLCERVSELERLKKVREKLVLVDTAINTETEKDRIAVENDDMMISVNGFALPGYETIPLIDVQSENEEVVEADKIRPKSQSVSHQFPLQENLLRKALSPRGKKVPLNGFDSPDIFHLRAPLVSWENFLTPAASHENILPAEN